MGKIVYFDYCALVVLLLVIVMMIVRNMTRGHVNNWFLLLLCLLFVTSAFDAATIVLDKLGPGNVAAKYITNTMYLWLRNQFSVWYAVYIFAQCDVAHKITSRRRNLLLFILPITVISVILLFINPIYHVFFYLDANDVYTRGPYILLLYALSLTYMIVALVVLVKYRKVIGTKNCIFLSIAFFMVFIATVIQFLWPDYIVEMFCSSVGCLVLAMTVQAPEGRVHAGTGLYITSAFERDVRIHKALNKDFDVIFITVTNMKSLLDILGFMELNKLIKQIANHLISYTKKNHIDCSLYYFENGCFACVIAGKARSVSVKMATDINSFLIPNFNINEMELKIMANVCHAEFPQDIPEVEFLVPFSERLALESYTGDLYYAKDLFVMTDYAIARDMSEIINRCLVSNSIKLFYQPVFDTELDRYVSCEAFLRINDPVYGQIPPMTIIEAAEKSGDIHGITAFVIEKACKLISDPNYFAMGIDWIEINLSPIQCMWDDLVTVLFSTMENYGVAPEQMCINITDVDSVQIYEKMAQNMTKLAEAGIKLYMDDFGAGVFEIERLTALPLDGIKFDKEFVKAGTDGENKSVLKHTVKMITDMGMKVAAVGVEDPVMRRKLLDMNCNVLQGYYYCKPMSREEIIPYLITR